MFRASSLTIISSVLLYIRHWYVSCRFLMTASKQNQDGTQMITSKQSQDGTPFHL